MSRNYSVTQNAGRFVDLCTAFDICKQYSDLDVDSLLCRCMFYHYNGKARNITSEPNRTGLEGGQCRILNGVPDGRVQLPESILVFMFEHSASLPWVVSKTARGNGLAWGGGAKVTVTWLSCYIWNVRPDQTQPGWEYFECSHRCLNAGQGESVTAKCTYASHLTWESKAANQSRAGDLCATLCHCGCGEYICRVYEAHFPQCI